MIVIVRCGLAAPRSTWFYIPWFSHQRHPVVTTRDSSGEAGKHGWEKWPLNFAYEVSFHARKVLLHAVNLRHGTYGFTSPPKEGVLRILSPLKSNSSAGFEPANLGSSGKHANHYTEGDHPLWLSRIISSTYWINLERRMSATILYVVDNNAIPRQLVQSLLPLFFMNRYNINFLLLHWQLFLVPNRTDKCADLIKQCFTSCYYHFC
jgi:hypothetical protein